ncbi:MAG TPA: hypothetical protein PKJ25_09790 [Smithellaceae bacterium]|nr:hypothetical protein [Smithellaceae bacterium]
MKINIEALDQTIRKICEEVKCMADEKTEWRNLSEEALLYEVAVCIFGSQMVYEHSIAMVDFIKKKGMLCEAAFTNNYNQYEENLRALLSEPLNIEKNGISRKIKPRFKNRLSKLLTRTIQNVYGNEITIKYLLNSAANSLHARKLLVNKIFGFGPKQASLFLRRIGYCSELAVLDTHILDYLKISSGVDMKATALSKLTWYEYVESAFKRISDDFGYSVGCVDLATWVTMRVAKREYTI